MSSPRIVRLEKSRLLILPGQTVNGCGAVWPSEFFTTLLVDTDEAERGGKMYNSFQVNSDWPSSIFFCRKSK